MRVIKVALTGGIAAGKSVAAHRLRERGAHLIDYDQIARLVVEPGSPGLAAVVQDFGSQVLDGQGRLDRAALADIIFDDADARAQLNGILHPAICAEATQRERQILLSATADGLASLIRKDSLSVHDWPSPQASNRHDTCVIVHDIPLLVESKILDNITQAPFDVVVTVYAPAALRLDRLVKT